MPLTPTRHPSAQALANLLIGDCSPGAALLVGLHIEACPQCAARLRAMGAAGAPAAGACCEPAQTLRPGVEIARVSGASGVGEAVMHVRAAPAAQLPLDEPLPASEVLVLEGGFSAGSETYRAGDFLSLDDDIVHGAVSDPDRGCCCLVTYQDEFGLHLG